MSVHIDVLMPTRETQTLLVKWLVALLVPISVFTFVWNGEAIVNNALLALFAPRFTTYDLGAALQAAIFLALFYATVIALAGYLVAADSGGRGIFELWVNVLIFVVVPLLFIILVSNLIIGLTASAVVWGLYFLFYPAIDPMLFGYGTDGRLSGYGDAGYYIILALGLNIVVGFAGLLDLGYVAFFAIGSYTWGMVGSQQFQTVTGIVVNPQIWPWLFWPLLLVAAVIAAIWGVLLGAPTLRLRGDYLAIVTLGFGEIAPIIFLELDKYTNGTNGIVGVSSPRFPGITWSSFTPIPYYYLILALIALLIFVNIRLRDSRLGRAWVAVREDEIVAASSGINLSRTKLLAFAAGAFFSGVAGAYHAAKLGGVTPDDFNYADSIIYLAMVVIGGLGSIPGVIVGAIVVYSINLFVLTHLDTLASDPGSPLHILTQLLPGFTFDSFRNLIFGAILIVVMLFRPEGLIPSARRRRELHHAEDEAPEEEALDTPPAMPGIEEEIILRLPTLKGYKQSIKRVRLNKLNESNLPAREENNMPGI